MLMSWAVTRSLFPTLLILPSSTVPTRSCWPIFWMSSFLPLNAKHDVRAGTFKPLIFDSAVMISSLKPSLRYSSFLSWLMLAKGRTATDFSFTARALWPEDLFGDGGFDSCYGPNQ